MSSKRGRKRNDSLPPNRARDVQRAFRARRAAHLLALEQRVAELEEENECFRQALSLPPANRPPLGKGPTGKDKPKPYDHPASGYSLSNSRDSSSSPGSTRTSSLSPSAIAAVMPRPLHEIEAPNWDQALVMPEHTSDESSPTEPTTYHPISPTSASFATTKSLHYSYASPLPSSRGSVPDIMYPMSSPQAYAPPVGRIHTNYAPGGQNFGMHEETSEQQFSYSQPSFSPTSPVSIHGRELQTQRIYFRTGYSPSDATARTSHWNSLPISSPVATAGP